MAVSSSLMTANCNSERLILLYFIIFFY